MKIKPEELWKNIGNVIMIDTKEYLLLEHRYETWVVYNIEKEIIEYISIYKDTTKINTPDNLIKIYYDALLKLFILEESNEEYKEKLKLLKEILSE